MNRYRLFILSVIAAAVVAWFALDAGRYAGAGAPGLHFTELRVLVEARPVAASLAYFAVYVAVAALSIPGGALACTLAGGALFGLAWGCVLVSFASSCGATAACAVARFVLREFVERRFPAAVARADAGVRSDGAYYLLGLRLATVVPFWIINLAMGLTRLPLRTFYWVSQLGMVPSTVIFVNAGTQLGRIHGSGDVLSPALAGSLLLLGLFPLAARRMAGAVLVWHRRHR